MSVYVDDILCAASSVQVLKDFRVAICARFEMTDLGPVKSILGMTVSRDRQARTLRISQEHFVDNILSTFSYERLSSNSNPASRSHRTSPSNYRNQPATFPRDVITLHVLWWSSALPRDYYPSRHFRRGEDALQIHVCARSFTLDSSEASIEVSQGQQRFWYCLQSTG